MLIINTLRIHPNGECTSVPVTAARSVLLTAFVSSVPSVPTTISARLVTKNSPRATFSTSTPSIKVGRAITGNRTIAHSIDICVHIHMHIYVCVCVYYGHSVDDLFVLGYIPSTQFLSISHARMMCDVLTILQYCLCMRVNTLCSVGLCSIFLVAGDRALKLESVIKDVDTTSTPNPPLHICITRPPVLLGYYPQCTHTLLCYSTFF